MSVKDKSNLKIELDETIYENIEGEILASEVNTLLTDIIDSVVVTDDGSLDNYYTSGQTDTLLATEISARISGDTSLSEAIQNITVNYDTELDPSLSVPTSVGGISAGTLVSDLKGDSLISMFDNLLFPTINPVFVNPSSTFTKNQSVLQEIGSTINIDFTSTLNRGSITLNGVFQDYRSGLASGYNWSGTELSTPTQSSVQSLVGYTVAQGNQTWTGTVSYSEGPQPKDNKGNDYSTPLPSGTTTGQSTTIEGVYPLYGTTSSISNPDTKQTLVSMLTGNNIVFSMVSESGGNKQSFDIPVAWTSSRPLSNVQTYNTVSSQWETTGLSQWTTSSVQHSGVNYTRYTYNALDRGAVNIRLVF